LGKEEEEEKKKGLGSNHKRPPLAFLQKASLDQRYKRHNKSVIKSPINSQF